MRRVLLLTVLLGGCSTAPATVPFEPTEPRAALMKAPEKAPAIAPGESLYDNNAKLRGALDASHVQVRGLQGYIRTLLKERLKRQQTAKAKT